MIINKSILYLKLFSPLFLIFIFAYQAQKLVFSLGLDLHHDLIMFDAARQMLYGAIPFKDFFYQYNLATIFLHKISLSFFGEYILSLKIITALSFSIISVMIYKITEIIGHRKAGLVFAFIWTMLSPFYMPALNGYHPWSTVYMMASIMIGLYFLLKGLRSSNTGFYFFAGIFLSLAFWFKQVAAIQILVILVWFGYGFLKTADKNKILKKLIFFSIGGLVASIPFVFYLVYFNAFYEWFSNIFLFNKLFVQTANSSNGFFNFIKNMLPIKNSMGYISLLWAIIPIYLIFSIMENKLSFSNKFRDKSSILILFLSIAGWLEYYPLAHEFHTHLFMAPFFCYLAIDLFRFKNNTTIFLLIFKIILIVVLLFEVFVHTYGIYKKRAVNWNLYYDESPAKGLFFNDNDYYNFKDFSKSLIEIYKNNDFIPLSVDPIGGLNQYYTDKRISKMGLNWSWPNEIVEPGINNLIVNKLRNRSDYVFADSMIAIPGYNATKLLEMDSPITKTHIIFKPSASINNIDTFYSDYVTVTNKINIINNYYLNYKINKKLSANFDREFLTFPASDKYILHPLIKSIPSSEILNIHISYITDFKIPKKLSDLEYNLYLNKQSYTNYYPKINNYYEFRKGSWFLIDSLSAEESAEISKFFLMTGKLLDQNLPKFASTLMSNVSANPFIVSIVNNNYELAWSSSIDINENNILDNENSFIAVQSDHTLISPGMAYIQIVMNDNRTCEWFVRIQ